MSNFLAIATVSAALRRLVLEAVQADVPGAAVTTLRPAEPGAASGIPALGANLYLYEVAPIPPLRNEHLPTRRNNGGAMVHRPVAALELHYLFTFYGNDAVLEPQRLMGSTIAKLIAQPLLTRDRITATLAAPGTAFLAGSDLGDQVDAVKFTPFGTSLEEMSRIWSVFFQTRYALSMSWRASAVLVEPRLRATPAVPVLEPRLAVVPIRLPFVTRVVSSAGDELPILPGDAITIRGERLRALDLEVVVGGTIVAPVAVEDVAIELTLPAGLRAGPQSVQVLHRLALGDPPAPHRGTASNAGEFVLHPEVAQSVPPAYDIAKDNVVVVAGLVSADVTVTMTIDIGRGQQVTLELLTPAAGTTPARPARTFNANARAAAGRNVTIQVVDVAAGTYVVRVRVDGAESATELDTNPASPTFGQPIAPTLVLP